MSKKKAIIGRCKLTGNTGRYVKSHILPRALTKPELNGERLLQLEPQVGISHRRDSWYDKNLVCSEGEAILSNLDNYGIHELRKHNLVWSASYPIGKAQLPIGKKLLHAEGELTVTIDDPNRFRRFWASLLWRSAASLLPDMADVQLPPDHTEQLRAEVTGETAVDPFFYPISLMHFCTTGPRHNFTTITRFLAEEPPRNFYLRHEMDGIVSLSFPLMKKSDLPFSDWNVVVGNSKCLHILSRPYQDSWAHENLKLAIKQTRNGSGG